MTAADLRSAALGLEQAERLLLALELFGIGVGLERITALLSALGDPQRKWRAIHVVGTNGKSSTVRMAAAIARHHGRRTGSYLSPHLASFTERVRIDDADVSGSAFAVAVGRAAAAAAQVTAATGDGQSVTQFELLTAAAFDCFAAADVDLCVIEAGLGGRYDATNVIDAEVVALTSIGLEHTRYLGDSVAAIAGEKLAVLKPGARLVIAPDLDDQARAVADQVCQQRGAQLIVAPADPGSEIELLAAGDFQRRNFAVAATAVAALLGHKPDRQALAAAARGTAVPGRMQVIDRRPLTLLDGAHNASGIETLLAAVGAITAGRRLVCCVGMLADKDAEAMLAPLLKVADTLVLTAPDTPRALAPERLAELARQLPGEGQVEICARPAAALAQARQLAGADGVVLATGSIYLVADLLAPARTVRSTL